VNRFWRLDQHPDGNDFAAAFSLAEEPLRSPADGEVLVRNRYLSLDAGASLDDIAYGRLPAAVAAGRAIKHGARRGGGVTARRVCGWRSRARFGTWGDHSLMRPELESRDRERSVADPRQPWAYSVSTR
jgi:hypothetical protein